MTILHCSKKELAFIQSQRDNQAMDEYQRGKCIPVMDYTPPIPHLQSLCK